MLEVLDSEGLESSENTSSAYPDNMAWIYLQQYCALCNKKGIWMIDYAQSPIRQFGRDFMCLHCNKVYSILHNYNNNNDNDDRDDDDDDTVGDEEVNKIKKFLKQKQIAYQKFLKQKRQKQQKNVEAEAIDNPLQGIEP